ncbi:protein of unknown function [Magnetospirillum gryphiswaldense MSR-1 v2]|uniref:Uncharacterized protein n=1 Tax=Magnetospirillum gryphiswaldense (strain DSM 6361 / JCM 21280 / NBRC 15271 / MSR-1) TaxID=431944 RepID=V6F0Z0_MAGGM|nr:hypothetical protein [Magnetospirillum gryphiswaldense]CDK99057.1 protein of unknown function [Magnetospirillum gryphiswaldense MSR-1 v2]
MGDLTTSPLDPRNAALQIRPTASAALRPADPTRERFQVGDNKVANQDSEAVEDRGGQFAIDADETGGLGAQAVRQKSARGGHGLLGAFTNFLAKIFTQADGTADSAASVRLNGIGAYGRANAQQPQSAATQAMDNVQNPGFPRLASGRVLDLMA